MTEQTNNKVVEPANDELAQMQIGRVVTDLMRGKIQCEVFSEHIKSEKNMYVKRIYGYGAAVFVTGAVDVATEVYMKNGARWIAVTNKLAGYGMIITFVGMASSFFFAFRAMQTGTIVSARCQQTNQMLERASVIKAKVLEGKRENIKPEIISFNEDYAAFWTKWKDNSEMAYAPIWVWQKTEEQMKQWQKEHMTQSNVL